MLRSLNVPARQETGLTGSSVARVAMGWFAEGHAADLAPGAGCSQPQSLSLCSGSAESSSMRTEVDSAQPLNLLH